MAILEQVLALIVTLGILVTVHEFGHFWVARRCGVRVLRFSVGFGKPLAMWKDRTGTEFAVAAIPLGGYVRMLDEREGEVPEALKSEAFNTQPVKSRIAIAAAGPIANFLFAIVAYFLMFLWGFNTVVPIVGDVREDSPAAVAGLKQSLEIVAVDGEATHSWQDVNLQLLSRLGDSGVIELEARFPDQDLTHRYSLQVNRWLHGHDHPDPLYDLGIRPYRPPVEPVIGEIISGLPADRAGVQAGDKIISINAEAIASWYQVVDVIKSAPEQVLQVELERNGNRIGIEITPQAKASDGGQPYGYIGAGVKPVTVSWPDEMVRTVQLGVFEAVPAAFVRTWEDVALTLSAIKKIIVGSISLKTLSGPITIAQIAEESVSNGVEAFLHFLAYLSVTLGVLNLLPIPVLDGGHLLYYFAELVRGKPLSEKVQIAGLKVGVALIVSLMVVAFYNDILRIL
ncbi:membrane-associated zinc metalloprotease [Oleiphilus messinensis]|uniref:Zinc metalloprotease n=1 Tax=Oleiphilus messinensis TaxID=141451 RepID=A0A1Y0I6J3_9GAMM|nr:RIP metalloprotease RseP [Oleiphilus messinensis]ARU56051.1 membrane-associated zinc metalloprotease [Oleiphilus messinensis]